MRNVAITGASGYIGTQLIKRLEQEEAVESIIGISRRPPQVASTKLRFYSHDIRAPFEDIFMENNVDAAVHLAFVVSATRDSEAARQTDIDGSRNFLEACNAASVKRISFLSSYSAYGAHPDNPDIIHEMEPLRPNGEFPYPSNKAEVDRMFQEYLYTNLGAYVSIIRAVVVTGPASDGGPLASFLKNPVVMTVKGHDPLWQFIHEEDLIELIVHALKHRCKGIFNAAGDGSLSYSEMMAKIGKKCVSMPNRLASIIIALTWKLRLQSDAPGGGSMSLLKYPIVVSTDKIKNKTGFQFKYTGPEAFHAFLESARGNVQA
ncbi:MAG: NAD-dependent epimerase/dehydratase family protein [Chloroflexota bacterium]|nr:NAD-dependent epimerase/dehydratase family protein [Chloroflexota bacterium]